jgi:hypothetical protein
MHDKHKKTPSSIAETTTLTTMPSLKIVKCVVGPSGSIGHQQIR